MDREEITEMLNGVFMAKFECALHGCGEIIMPQSDMAFVTVVERTRNGQTETVFCKMDHVVEHFQVAI